MVEGIIAQRYAKALLNLTPSSADIESTSNALNTVAQLYDETAELKDFILEPKYSRSKKSAVIKEIVGKLDSGKLIERFCRFLLEKRRFSSISSVATNYQRLGDEKLGRATAHIVTAHELSAAEKKKLQDDLSTYSGKKIEPIIETDPSIIGGVITTIGSLVLDGSIRNRLNLIRENLSEGN